ncbi:MAG: hypothetical protein F6K39_41190 [Okeania sp. SIO3B3]|nr:hypothetical protein [Okeania sp. SIO3B3]
MGIEPTQLAADSSHTPLKNYGVRFLGGLANFSYSLFHVRTFYSARKSFSVHHK